MSLLSQQVSHMRMEMLQALQRLFHRRLCGLPSTGVSCLASCSLVAQPYAGGIHIKWGRACQESCSE